MKGWLADKEMIQNGRGKSALLFFFSPAESFGETVNFVKQLRRLFFSALVYCVLRSKKVADSLETFKQSIFSRDSS